ncbi:MAG: UDP-glucose 4-epimerase GalE [Bacteroidales bacterium]|nr:UDP-glucose 4-epimerase GalE [Bacteroidales bacterium]
MNSKILVTGGAGYIGSHTVVELLEKNFNVIIIDNLSNSRIESLDGIKAISGKQVEFEEFDLCDKNSLKDFFLNNRNISAIIHFAASKAVGESVENPLKYYQNNLGSLMNILENMEEFSVPNLVFSSSCTVYGQAKKLPVTEDTPILPAASPYGNTKQIAEEIIKDTSIASTFIKAIALRYFNPIGAHPSALIGELPLGTPENLVPYITQTGIGIRNFLRVFGDDYDTPDGSAIRDYLHVVDLAKAHVVAIERLLDKRNKEDFEVFNLGTGNGISVFEMIKSFERVSGLKLKYDILDRRQGDIEKIWADTSLANNELGWRTLSSLDEAMETAWEWEKYYRSNN